MSDQLESTTVAEIEQQQLSQWLPQHSQVIGKTLDFSITEQKFSQIQSQVITNSNIELVVFSDITMVCFATILTSIQIKQISLSAINNRNNLTSYRFVVNVGNLCQARAKLVEINLEFQIESALLDNAPKLNQPGLLVMDMDSTAIKVECIDEIAALAGVGEEVAKVTEQAMQGKLDFKESLYQRVSKLENAPESILKQVINTLPLMDGLTGLVHHLKVHQWRIAIASGGFTYFANHLKNELTLDHSLANQLEIKNGLLTGNVLGEVIDAQAKATCLTQLQQKYAISSTQTVAMGDGANDLIMMAAAQLGVAHHAKPIVLTKADTCITQSGLDCLLHWLK